MIRKMSLGIGFAAGYVLGAKAGTQRYEQIVSKARELAGMPVLQEATSGLKETASTLTDTARSKASDATDALNDKVASTGTRAGGGGGGDGGGKKTVDISDKAPMVGATASGSAPDVTGG